MILTQIDKWVKIIRSDSGWGGYIIHKFQKKKVCQGTKAQLSCFATPQQNGVVERKHHHILDMARSLIYSLMSH